MTPRRLMTAKGKAECFAVVLFSVTHFAIAQDNSKISSEPVTSSLPMTYVDSSPNVEIEQVPLAIRQLSPGINLDDFKLQLKNLAVISRLRADHVLAKHEQLTTRYAKIQQLATSGHASAYELKRAKVEWENSNDRLVAERNYQGLVEKIQDKISSETYLQSLQHSGKGSYVTEFEVRLPSLSLRVGNLDLFTAKLKAETDSRKLVSQHSAAKIRRVLAAPNKGVFREYFEKRQKALENLSAVLPSEMQHAEYQIDSVKRLGKLADHQFVSRWQDGMRVANLSQFKGFSEKGAPVKTRAFVGTKDSFWLFGDGEAAAVPVSTLSVATLEIAKRKAESNHRIDATEANADKARTRLTRIQKLLRQGYSSRFEVEKEKLKSQLADLELEKAKAEKFLAVKEYEQLKLADIETRDRVWLPEDSSDMAWMKWLGKREISDSNELIHFLKLAQTRFQNEAEKQIGNREYEFEADLSRAYSSVSSLKAIEKEKLYHRHTLRTAQYRRALEDENTTLLSVHQWAQRVYAGEDGGQMPDVATMQKIVESGKQVGHARIEVARIDAEQKKLIYLDDTRHLSRLSKMGRGGAVSGYEKEMARLDAEKSRGQLITALKDFAIAKQETIFTDSLFDSASMSYDEKKGLQITRFMPEAIEELEKLTLLKEGIDDGKIRYLKAEIAEHDLKIRELRRLVSSGHASQIEVERATVRKKTAENALAVEMAKDQALPFAMALVRSLEFRPEATKERIESKL